MILTKTKWPQIGSRFGYLTVIGAVFSIVKPGTRKDRLVYRRRRFMVVCECTCGKCAAVDLENLKAGKSTSCGCVKGGGLHTLIHGDHKARLYKVWTSMRQRCQNPQAHSYHRYGGRGITVCAEWNDYQTFKAWALANGYADHDDRKKRLTIDRKDNDKGYCPDNCQWLTKGANGKKIFKDWATKIRHLDARVSQLEHLAALLLVLLTAKES